MSETDLDRFEQCQECPSLIGCSAASYCVMECRFHYANMDITAPVCGTCDRSARDAWSCIRPEGAECAAQSDLWGQWFLVQMYAQDEKRRRTAGADAEPAVEDDDEPCYHDCDESCYDEYDEWRCNHSHCFNCGGCGCPGYCDDYQTYNLRPAETGGALDDRPA